MFARSHRNGAGSASVPKTRLRFEQLEDRTLPSTTLINFDNVAAPLYLFSEEPPRLSDFFAQYGVTLGGEYIVDSFGAGIVAMDEWVMPSTLPNYLKIQGMTYLSFTFDSPLTSFTFTRPLFHRPDWWVGDNPTEVRWWASALDAGGAQISATASGPNTANVVPSRTFTLTGSSISSVRFDFNPAIDDWGQFGIDSFVLERNTDSDIAMSTTKLVAKNKVEFTYQTLGNPGRFDVAVYRSRDGKLDSGDILASDLLSVSPANVSGSQTGVIELHADKIFDPLRPYVFVVADPNHQLAEANEANNEAHFRKLVVGVVTHGLSTTGRVQPWVGTAKLRLQSLGYTEVIAPDWAARSTQRVSGVAVQVGNEVSQRIRRTVNRIADQTNDVVDLHFIGHSRGTVVNSEAMRKLYQTSLPEELRFGYLKVTMLDPHPASNSGSPSIGDFSYDRSSSVIRQLAVTVLYTQYLMNDPNVFVHPKSDEVEDYFQRLPYSSARGTDRYVNLLGERPSQLVNPAHLPVLGVNIGDLGLGTNYSHTYVPDWYLRYILVLP